MFVPALCVTPRIDLIVKNVVEPEVTDELEANKGQRRRTKGHVDGCPGDAPNNRPTRPPVGIITYPFDSLLRQDLLEPWHESIRVPPPGTADQDNPHNEQSYPIRID